jgi:hypothetical protein
VTRDTRRTLAAVVAAVMLTIGGCAAATVHHTASDGERVELISYSNDDGPRSGVIVTGAIGDYGEAVSVYPNGSVDPQHDSQLEFELTKGSFRVDISDVDKEIVNAFSGSQPDPRTCSGQVRESASAPIVRGSGTRAYENIGGTMSLTISFAEIVPHTRCDWTAAFVRQVMVVEGVGTVSFD